MMDLISTDMCLARYWQTSRLTHSLAQTIRSLYRGDPQRSTALMPNMVASLGQAGDRQCNTALITMNTSIRPAAGVAAWHTPLSCGNDMGQ